MNIDILTNDPSYVAYMKKVSGMLKTLPASDQQEIQNEIKSHLYESLFRSPELSVDDALLKFGQPDAYLPEWVVVKKMEMAARSYDPIRIFSALFMGIKRHSTHAFKYTLFAILYILTFCFGALSIIKILSPSHTGFFVFPRGFAFGYTDNISGAYEVLGTWFIPICLFITIMLYVLITSLLKRSMDK